MVRPQPLDLPVIQVHVTNGHPCGRGSVLALMAMAELLEEG